MEECVCFPTTAASTRFGLPAKGRGPSLPPSASPHKCWDTILWGIFISKRSPNVAEGKASVSICPLLKPHHFHFRQDLERLWRLTKGVWWGEPVTQLLIPLETWGPGTVNSPSWLMERTPSTVWSPQMISAAKKCKGGNVRPLALTLFWLRLKGD